MSKPFVIAVEGPWFYSAKDEELFFAWWNSLPSVVDLGGVGTMLEITFVRKRISRHDLLECLAVFRRYRMDTHVLTQFDGAGLAWFRDPGAYWHAEVFGSKCRLASDREADGAGRRAVRMPSGETHKP